MGRGSGGWGLFIAPILSKDLLTGLKGTYVENIALLSF